MADGTPPRACSFKSIPGMQSAILGATFADQAIPLDGSDAADAVRSWPTDTVDYAFVIEGEPALELEDGGTVPLRPGDVVVQNGTRHAWRNPGTTPVSIAFVLVGVQR